MDALPCHIADGFPGQRMIVLPQPVVSKALDHQLPVGMLPSDIGYFPDAHFHYFERRQGCAQLILILCVRGSGWVNIRENQYKIGPGQLVVLLPHEPHRYAAEQEHPWTIYWCHAAGEAAGQVGHMLRGTDASPVQQVADEARMVRLFEEILDELDRGYGLNQLVPAALTLAHLLGLALVSRRIPPNAPDAVLRVREAIEYMQQHQSGNISVPELAKLLNLSASHFSALFKKTTGFPPLDYFVRLKIRRSCELLDLTRLPVKQIAEDLGFSDPLYFSRVFHRIHGMSPTEYRQTIKG
jgi:AraC-like DNA-binding protein